MPDITWSWTLDISDLIVATGVLVALLVGVGSWSVEAIRRRNAKKRQRRSCMLFYQMRLLNSKFQICRVRSLLENVYGNANLDIQQRQDIDAETYKRMIPGLAIPNMFPHDSGLDMALIMPPKALYGVLRVNDLIYAWNQIISSSNYYDNPIPGDIQETQFGMLEMKERLINETSKRLEAETDHYFTYEQQDKNRP